MNLYLKQTPRMHPEDFFSSSISTRRGSELSQIYMQTGMRGKVQYMESDKSSSCDSVH